jgi:hypothetical protein
MLLVEQAAGHRYDGGETDLPSEQEPGVPAEAFAFAEKNSTILKLVRIGDGLSSPWGGVVALDGSPHHCAFLQSKNMHVTNQLLC